MKRFLIFIFAMCAFSMTNAATLNIKQNNITKQITLNTTKPTAPTLAVRVGNKTMYAAMARTTAQTSGNLYTKYNNQVYHILDTLPETKFTITTTSNTSSFNFKMSAMGTFYVDWGDGVVDEIVRTSTTSTTYSHTYTKSGVYNIGFTGSATGYSTGTEATDAAISFKSNTNVAAINGSLGAIFSTLYHCANGSSLCTSNQQTIVEQPIFRDVFRYCTNLGGTIPENLFSGIEGQPTQYIFAAVFYGCEKISGTIPENLFKNVKGYPVDCMFESLFSGCKNLTGKIPEKLFAGISGAPAKSMFAWTFNACYGLTGTIPAKLFSGISGVPVYGIYGGTFYNCTGLTGPIPNGLFGNLYGAPGQEMFGYTFSGATKMTGPTARALDGTRLYDIEYNGIKWQNDHSANAFKNTYTNTGIDINN